MGGKRSKLRLGRDGCFVDLPQVEYVGPKSFGNGIRLFWHLERVRTLARFRAFTAQRHVSTTMWEA